MVPKHDLVTQLNNNLTEQETIQLAFDVDAALLVELGERLVARRPVALAELIKNAYDADATEVIVNFDDVSSKSGQIVVEDNGSGMTLEAMKRGWMRVATTDAAVNARSAKFGRPRTGAKGIGRFACGRLASRLTLESVSKVPGGSERVKADFNWRDFTPGRDLSDVKSSITREVFADELSTGTTLQLRGLMDSWAEADVADLRAELGDLMNVGEYKGSVLRDPEYEVDPGFEALIIAPEFPRSEGTLSEPFMEAAWGLLTGKVTGEGEPNYELKIRDSDSVLQHQPRSRLFQELNGVTFTTRMMVYQGSRFRGSGYNLAEARQLGRQRGGVKVYLDGFRVFSYGSAGDDWLDLDQHRARRQADLPSWLEHHAGGLERPMLLLPGNMQLFGSVLISREQNPKLAASISRERLVENNTFSQLKHFVRDGIDWMTVCYARELEKRRDTRRPSTNDNETATQALQSARKTIARLEAIPEEIRQTIDASITEVATLLTKETESHASELSMLRVLASAGTTVVLFDHMLRQMAKQLDGIVNRLESTTRYVPPSHADSFQQAIEDLRSWSLMATGQGALVGLLVGPEARTRQRSHAIAPFVDQLGRGFEGYLSRYGINLENEVAAWVRTPPIYEAEVYAVLLNLLTNSFKAVRDEAERRVRVEARSSQQKFTLEVHDTGVGIPLNFRESVFEPFFTTSQPDPVLGVGTGLGLKIVRDLVRAWGGDVEFVDATNPWRTTIKLVVPNQGTE